jgi:hypothetical protein
MNRIHHIRRLAAALAGLAGTLLAFGAAPAFAMPPPPGPGGPAGAPAPVAPGWYKHPPLQPVHTAVIGGMPGWQIALIAIGAALLAATAAVLAYRAWTGRGKPATAAG